MQALSIKNIGITILLLTGINQCEDTLQKKLVDIPDQSFLQGLIQQGVDENGDGAISYQEAEARHALVLPPSGISDLTGLEAFVNLDSFSITLNPLNAIDLSSLTSLSYLECNSCELTSLDVSGNLLLEVLICGRNAIADLDVSANTALTRLIVNNNLFIHLDVSANKGLQTIITCGNQLTSLDISNNTSLSKIGIDNMSMLIEVCVWTLPFPPAGIVMLMDYSPNIQFTTLCSK